MKGSVDPLEFVERTLIARGALCERDRDRLEVLLPPETAAQLGLRESVSLGVTDEPGAILAGFGSEILERLIAEETAVLRRRSRCSGRSSHTPPPRSLSLSAACKCR